MMVRSAVRSMLLFRQTTKITSIHHKAVKIQASNPRVQTREQRSTKRLLATLDTSEIAMQCSTGGADSQTCTRPAGTRIPPRKTAKLTHDNHERQLENTALSPSKRHQVEEEGHHARTRTGITATLNSSVSKPHQRDEPGAG